MAEEKVIMSKLLQADSQGSRDKESDGSDNDDVGRVDPSASSEVAFKPARRVGTPPADRSESESGLPTPSQEAPPVRPKQMSTPRYEGVPSLQFGTSSPSQIARSHGVSMGGLSEGMGGPPQRHRETGVRFESRPSYDYDTEDYMDDEYEDEQRVVDKGPMMAPLRGLDASEASYRQSVQRRFEDMSDKFEDMSDKFGDISEQLKQDKRDVREDMAGMGQYVRQTFDDVRSMVSERICQTRESLGDEIAHRMAAHSGEMSELKQMMQLLLVNQARQAGTGGVGLEEERLIEKGRSRGAKSRVSFSGSQAESESDKVKGHLASRAHAVQRHSRDRDETPDVSPSRARSRVAQSGSRRSTHERSREDSSRRDRHREGNEVRSGSAHRRELALSESETPWSREAQHGSPDPRSVGRTPWQPYPRGHQPPKHGQGEELQYAAQWEGPTPVHIKPIMGTSMLPRKMQSSDRLASRDTFDYHMERSDRKSHSRRTYKKRKPHYSKFSRYSESESSESEFDWDSDDAVSEVSSSELSDCSEIDAPTHKRRSYRNRGKYDSSESESDADSEYESGRAKTRSRHKHRGRGASRGQSKGRGYGRRVSVPPPVFKESDDWTDFHIQFELCADANDWTDRQKAAHLCSALRGGAKSCLSLLGTRKARNYEKLVKYLTRQYAPTGCESRYGTQLMARTYKGSAKETLAKYLQQLKKLYVLAYGHSQGSDRVICDLFIRGLSGELKRMTQIQRPSNSREALDMAISIQSSLEEGKSRSANAGGVMALQEDCQPTSGRDNQKMNGKGKGVKGGQGHEEPSAPPSVAAVTADSMSNAQVVQAVQQLTEAVLKKNERKPMSQLQCHMCQQFGHIRPYCPMNPNRRPAPWQQRNNANGGNMGNNEGNAGPPRQGYNPFIGNSGQSRGNWQSSNTAHAAPARSAAAAAEGQNPMSQPLNGQVAAS